MRDQIIQILEGPKRHTVVITLTLVVGFVVVFPGVDKLIEARQEESALLAEVQECQLLVTDLHKVETEAQQREKRLNELVSGTVDNDRMHDFRVELVKLVRGSGCQLRHVRVGNVESRPWKKGSQFAARINAALTKEKTAYNLETHSISVSVTGDLPAVKNLLQHIQSTAYLMHVPQLTLHRSSQRTSQLTLEFELLLFNLQPATQA